MRAQSLDQRGNRLFDRGAEAKGDERTHALG